MIEHDSRAAGVLELHLGRVVTQLRTHRSGFVGRPTSLTGLFHCTFLLQAPGSARTRWSFSQLRKPRSAGPGPHGGFHSFQVLLGWQHSREHIIQSSRRFLESSDNFQVQMSEELTTGDTTEPQIWEQELVRAWQLPLGEADGRTVAVVYF